MSKVYAFIPAAGSGTRMGGDIPKQYALLQGRPLLYHALASLCGNAEVERVFVVLKPGDQAYGRFDWRAYGAKLAPLYCGGATRAASVYNGLIAARDAVAAEDWVLVHDAVRPCLAASVLQRLIDTVRDESVGGLLALPVVDTLKRADARGYVQQTEAREGLWQAQTPQMFRYRLLVEALRTVDPELATDDARAIEARGLRPKLVLGDTRNLKVTYAQDLALAELILAGPQDDRR